MSGEICADNRFKLIAKYKAKLIESTNIETSEDEMAVIDNILFRFWQMGWLDKLDTCENTCEITRKSNASDHHRQNIETYAHDMGVSIEQAEKELQLPSAGQTGEWIMITDKNYFTDWKCSLCGGSGRGDYLFCPNCGARMVSEDVD